MSNRIFASKYQLGLPSPEDLKKVVEKANESGGKPAEKRAKKAQIFKSAGRQNRFPSSTLGRVKLLCKDLTNNN